ncbi:hypothetical protein PR048_007506 [Dryococelus australis]|uniref:Uncharacterized protein n=1 Tax=Dryococelus australis TaxID=614101 RepID=A0ABQ9HVB4_9NEOP|nr:hypothetical protein PR048_007506 [Dryococelus australis]
MGSTIERWLLWRLLQKHCIPAMTSFPNLPVVTVGGRPDLNRAALKDPSASGRKRRERLEPQVSKLTERSVIWSPLHLPKLQAGQHVSFLMCNISY